MARKVPTGLRARLPAWLLVLVSLQPLLGCAAQSPGAQPPTPDPPAARPLGRGMNFGNALEAPNEGDWGVTLREEFAEAVAGAGFATVRLPVKWSAHAAATAPYALDPAFLARVDEVSGWLLDRGLNVILDFHHYDELFVDPQAHTERWLAIWRQLAEHYQDAPDLLLFELLNEPNGALDAATWNDLAARGLAAVRESNPTRRVVIGPANYNAIGSLAGLSWPDDANLVVTVHFYHPFAFTHQGAEWATPVPPVGVPWTGESLGPRAGFADWSWGTERGYDRQLTLTFTGGWTGYYLHADQPVGGFDRLALATSRAVELLVSCSDGESSVAVTTRAGEVEEVPFPACGATGGATTGVVIQNGTPDAQPPFVLETLELRGAGGALPLLVSEAAAVGAWLDIVAAWAEAHGGPPVLIGEFGANRKADMASRVRWTRAVREAAEARGFAWAYWELAAEFAAYDAARGAWHEELLDALTGPPHAEPPP